MDLSEIAAIAGKGGLFHVLKPSRSGMIVESLDEQKKKMMVNMNQRVSVLKEVSIYTTDAEGAVPLEDVFQKIHEEFGDDPGVDTSDGEELKAFLKHVVPEYDESRVYVSDMKKLVNWYSILLKYAPEAVQPPDELQEKEKGDSEEVEVAPEPTTPEEND
ncbi:DUF5606 family protein [Tunicatimonas pelagia]|uniref:DUF5606 family protein n=1 Tax=Tunicatimonas pelagia TaxID=931531 RepID=UPI00266628E4|nr:DUF5606 domain-containing protein [Tunicatimonas pelagia]WKN41469.1 DUF5606 domain-containing protein [Tunicatimonas pelagia]